MFRLSFVIVTIYLLGKVNTLPAASVQFNDLISVLESDGQIAESGAGAALGSYGSDVGSLIVFVKDQIKSILIDIALQLYRLIKSTLHHFKVKLLKKLGTYTLSDLFHTVFDGVTGFVVEPDEYSLMPRPIPDSPMYYGPPLMH